MRKPAWARRQAWRARVRDPAWWFVWGLWLTAAAVVVPWVVLHLAGVR
jgi:hypothetical protein